MEGASRKGHFDGVGTVVKRLLEIVRPNNAYFGEKDFQQLQIIRKMVEKNALKVRIIGCPIYRETNGLAMSSRNKRLTEEQRNKASIIYQTLLAVKNKFPSETIQSINHWVMDQFKNYSFFKLEYFIIANEETLKSASEINTEKNYRAFIAVYADSVRLIDNLSLND